MTIAKQKLMSDEKRTILLNGKELYVLLSINLVTHVRTKIVLQTNKNEYKNKLTLSPPIGISSRVYMFFLPSNTGFKLAKIFEYD